ncbi:MAG: rhodanese-like domain-containing protein [Chloroflexota bacterium]|nr:rhodanese-like domain-containing protein [Chloroflexota bacterium]
MVQITPFVDEGLGNSSYLVDLGDGRALVVDPVRDVEPYVRFANQQRLKVEYSLETHLHADFVSGSLELARLGATILAPRGAHAEFPHRPLDDADEYDLGGLVVRGIGTPGHTPEHLSYLILDGRHPAALFSGGALIVGSVARTDLISPAQTEPLARALFRALRERILPLPDELPVYPTHGAGSFCSAPGIGERTTTIGRERASNPLLSAPDEDAFLHRLTAGLGSYPEYFLHLREVNRRGPAVYGSNLPRLTQLAPADLQAATDAGAELIDVRPITHFAGGHIPGALSIALRPAFAPWLGWLVEAGRALVFVADTDQDRADLVRQCLKIGYEHLAGELADGMEKWRAAGLPEQRTELSANAPARQTPILDVRQSNEYLTGHVPAAIHLELGSVAGQVAGLRSANPLVMCGHGERAMTGASLLERDGSRPSVFLGGPNELVQQRGERLASSG